MFQEGVVHMGVVLKEAKIECQISRTGVIGDSDLPGARRVVCTLNH